MCGIIGIVSLGVSRIDKLQLKQMTDIIAHRGPDGEGHWLNDDRTIGFGHRRLSIIDLSPKGRQPMEYKNLVITYNGEIYNYIELRKELIQEGYTFSSDSDTEVILASYDHWGEECVLRLNGMWSFIIFDKINNIAFCSRDRFGIKPFYYYQANNQLYLASEIKQFTIVPGWKAKINKTRAFDFIQNSLINHTSETLFDQVYELRGGHNLIIDLTCHDYRIERYYLPNKTTAAADNMVANSVEIENFNNLMNDAVKLAMRSDVKVGSALSGGIDSSIIASVSSELLKADGKPGNQECISACFTDDKIDESFYIDALSDYADIKVHKVYPSFLDFINNLDKIVWHQDEPFATLSIYAQYTVFREAAVKGITVMLDGQGADEILAGYSSFYKPHLTSLLKINPLNGFKLIIDYLRIHKEYNLHLIFKHLLKTNRHLDLFASGYKDQIEKPFKRPIETSIEECSFNHLTGFGLHSLLRYEDRNSMAFSVESRVPFLDFRVVRLSLSLKDELKINKGVRKYILREAFKNNLPGVIYKRYDKLGFPTPQQRWTIENKSIFVSLLKEAKLLLEDKIISREKLNQLLTTKSLNNEDISTAWRIIIFSRWVKVYNVNIGTEFQSN